MSQVNSMDRDVDVDLGRLFASLLRDWRRILGVAIAVSLVALLVSLVATPHYRAETRLLIETRESVFTRPAGDTGNGSMLDEEGVTSQVELITSTDILKDVARKFDFAQRDEFGAASGLGAFDYLMVLTGLKTDPTDVPAEERVLKVFREKLSVYRVERSRVIVISFSSEDPKLAADVPNAIAEAYLAVNRDAKVQSNSAATDWLEPEIKALAERVQDAEARVASYRSQSDLLVGDNNAVLATQQLSELSTELSRVRANRAAAEANAESVRLALQGGGSLDAFPDVLSSGLVQRLRERQVQLNADIADLSTTLLENHPRIRAMRSQLADLDRQVAAEAQNVLQGLVNGAKSAQLREEQLVADLNRLKAESSRVGEKEVELRALEREAAAQRELLESYLTRYREAASRRDGNYLPADARVFSRAVMPLEPYFPKVVPIVGAAFIGALLVMAIATLLSELFSGRAMQAAAGGRFDPIEQLSMPAFARTGDDPEASMYGDDVEAGETHATADGAGMAAAEAARRLISSGTARALFISPEGDEAAASAVLVAREVADAGLRVLLIDLTATGAASGPMLDGTHSAGITNLLASEAKFVDVIHADHYSDCHIIPVGTADQAKAMRSVERLPIILDTLGEAYDMLIVECGPVGIDSVHRLVGLGTEILVSVIDIDDPIVALHDELVEAGYGPIAFVTPGGFGTQPVPDRSAA